jgi:hypothetical protein
MRIKMDLGIVEKSRVLVWCSRMELVEYWSLCWVSMEFGPNGMVFLKLDFDGHFDVDFWVGDKVEWWVFYLALLVKFSGIVVGQMNLWSLILGEWPYDICDFLVVLVCG